MARGSADFSSYADGALPAEWDDTLWAGGDGPGQWAAAADVAALDGFLLQKTVSTTIDLVALTASNDTGDGVEADMLVRLRLPTVDDEALLMIGTAAASGVAPVRQGMRLRVSVSEIEWVMGGPYDAGVPDYASGPAALDTPAEANGWIWVRAGFTFEPGSVHTGYARAWLDGDTEPVDWQLLVTEDWDALGIPIPHGMMGVATEGLAQVEFDWFSYDTTGIGAPDPVQPPATPTVSLSGTTPSGVSATGSAFSSPAAATHVSSQFRGVRESDDAVMFDTGTVAATVGPVSVTGLAEGVQHYVQVRYFDSNGKWSAWGSSALFYTETTPATPAVFLRDASTVGVVATGSAFSGEASHVSSQFRGVRYSDSVIVFDTGTVAATVGPVSVTGLVAGTRYYVQARYFDSNGNWSAWGSSALFYTKSGGNLVTDYASLKKAVARWLNRRDLEEEIPVFVQMAEQKFRRDRRCRLLVQATVGITADGADLPSAFKELESWFHDGPTYYGPIKTVGYDQLAELKATYGASGPPRYVAIVGTKAYFAPAPNTTYSTKRAYWAVPTTLSDSVTTNTLLTACPDVYLYGALAESAPFLKDDERLLLWRAELDARLSEMDLSTWNQQFGGTVRRLPRPIGG